MLLVYLFPEKFFGRKNKKFKQKDSINGVMFDK